MELAKRAEKQNANFELQLIYNNSTYIWRRWHEKHTIKSECSSGHERTMKSDMKVSHLRLTMVILSQRLKGALLHVLTYI